MTIMRKIKFAVVFSLLFVLVSCVSLSTKKNISKKDLGTIGGSKNYAIEVFENDRFFSVGSLEFNLDRNVIRILTFCELSSNKKIEPKIFIYDVEYCTRRDPIVFGGTTPLGRKFIGHTAFIPGSSIISDFFVWVLDNKNKYTQLSIRPLSDIGKKYQQVHLSNVYLGLECPGR